MSDFIKLTTAYLISNAASFICLGAAAYLAAHDKSGWGWFLFVGVLCVTSVKIKNQKTGVNTTDQK